MHQAKLETSLTEIMSEQGMIYPGCRVKFTKQAPGAYFDTIAIGAQLFELRKRKPYAVVEFTVHEVRQLVSWDYTALDSRLY